MLQFVLPAHRLDAPPAHQKQFARLQKTDITDWLISVASTLEESNLARDTVPPAKKMRTVA